MIVKGRGLACIDSHGREYLDATGGLWLAQIGHGRAELRRGAKRRWRSSEFFASFWDFTNEPAARLSRRLVELSPPNLERSTSRRAVPSRTRSPS